MKTFATSDPGTQELRQLLTLVQVTGEVVRRLAPAVPSSPGPAVLGDSVVSAVTEAADLLDRSGPGSGAPSLRALVEAVAGPTDTALAAGLSKVAQANVRRIAALAEELMGTSPDAPPTITQALVTLGERARHDWWG